MKTKMKLLDRTLIALLMGSPALAGAQAAGQAAQTTQAEQAPAQDPAAQCDAGGCQDGQGQVLFQLRTLGKRDPSTPADAAGSTALQPDRRVEVLGQAPAQAPGTAVATGRFSLNLANGGVVWATEDPAMGTAELAVSAPGMVPFDGTAITKPVQFYVRSNYSDFVRRYELTLYRSTDTDLVSPLVRLPLQVGNVSRNDWDGHLPDDARYRAGDKLVYVLRAYDAQGNYDETYPKEIELVRPEDAERGNQLLRQSTEQSLGTALSTEQAQSQSLLSDVFSGNGLRQQNIPLYGSRIRIQGRNLPADTALSINGESYPVDLERKFTAEYLVPVGQHSFDIALAQGPGVFDLAPPPAGQGAAAPPAGGAPGAPGAAPVAPPATHHRLDVDVTGRYFFGVGLADVTIAQNDITGSVDPSAVDSRYKDDVISDGRLAFYGKAKFQGKYLVTAQADTTEQDLKHLFDDFGKSYAYDVFRTLDPDLYYPTYGDDSTVTRDVDTQGRFYLRMDWDKNQALWGNYATGFTDTEYGQYVRSLYGAALDWRSRLANRWGDPVSHVRVFGSQPNSLSGHNEFLGTGGSLYYLKQTQIVSGSDQVVLRITNGTTGRVEQSVSLVRGTDYEIDAIQGRILLTRPLAQITRENLTSLTTDSPLDGYQQRLVVDYEYVPTGFDSDELSAGVRAKHWFGDHLGVGVTYVREGRDGQDYTLSGGDVTLQAGKGTYLKAEYTHTEALSTPNYYSDNGGFTFNQLNTGGPRSGDAKAVEARANLRELGWTAQDWAVGAWWRQVDAGYSTGYDDTGERIVEYGAEFTGQISPAWRLYGQYSKAEEGAQSLTQGRLTSEWRLGEADTIAAELRRVQEELAVADAIGTLGAVKYTHRFGDSLDLYGKAQLTLDDDHGRYADNDAYTVGGKYLFGNLSSVGAEYTDGDRGNAATVSAEYRMSPEHSFYGAYTDTSRVQDYDPLTSTTSNDGWTLGQRWRLSNQVNVFNESQMLKSDSSTESGLMNTFGLDFYPAQGWNAGFTLQRGDLQTASGGDVERRAVSLSGGRTSPDTDWQTKLEWRRDTGAEDREQWVSTNRLVHKFDESWRMAARLNYSKTTDHLDASAGAKFIEANLGFAWRPWNSTRWGVFGRYTYLYDLATLDQVGSADYDQRTQVLSLEGVYKRDQHWEFAGKAAWRKGEARYGRGTGTWFSSDTTFYAGQVRYELVQQWHAMAEYRLLGVTDGGHRSGWLVGLDRDVGANLRIGLGYNFTRFSDDLTDFDYDHKGWFINLAGYY